MTKGKEIVISFLGRGIIQGLSSSILCLSVVFEF